MSNDEVVLLVTTFSRVEKYIPIIENLLNRLWVDHPPCYFLTDGDAQKNKSVLALCRGDWVGMFLEGLLQLKKRHPDAKYVFHMLEDHCPLRACDSVKIRSICQLARRYELNAVAFPTYSWPWNETQDDIYPDDLIRGWRRIDVRQIGSERFAAVPRDFFRYFQVQPTIWNIDYLIQACGVALERGIRNVWQFEAMHWDGAAQHYVADYHWPTVHHGFLAAGKVNPSAITYMDKAIGAELYVELIRDLIGVGSPMLYWGWRASRGLAGATMHLWRRIRGVAANAHTQTLDSKNSNQH